MILYILAALCVAFGAALCHWLGAFAGLGWLWLLPLGALGAFAVCAAAVYAVLVIACACVDLNKPRQRYSRLFYWLIQIIVQVCFPVLRVRITTKGLEQRPKKGRYLLVSNHLHEIDPAVLHRYFPEGDLAFIGKKEVMDMKLVNKTMHATLSQFIDRENDRQALKTILTCIRLLKEDRCSIAVFPEGGIADDVKLQHFRPGVFKIAQKTGVPIVVCTLQGTNKVLPLVRKLKPSRVELHLLGVIQPEEYEGLRTTELAARIYRMMYADLPEEYKHPQESGVGTAPESPLAEGLSAD